MALIKQALQRNSFIVMPFNKNPLGEYQNQYLTKVRVIFKKMFKILIGQAFVESIDMKLVTVAKHAKIIIIIFKYL